MNPTKYLAARAAVLAEQADLAAQPLPLNKRFVSLGELLQRLATVTPSLRDAADYLLYLGIDAGGAPAWSCNAKVTKPAGDVKTQWAIARLKHVFYSGEFESDGPDGISTDYEYFGFDRQQFADFLSAQAPGLLDLFSPLPQADTVAPVATIEGVVAPPDAPKQTAAQRQDSRLAACEADGLKMPASSRGRLPDGVAKVAARLGVTRQAFSTALKAALRRRETSAGPARIVRRT